MYYRIIAVIGSVALFTGSALAQAPTPVETNFQPDFATNSTAPLGWLRFRRFLSFDPVKDSELTLAIANRLLTEAQAQQNSQPAKATTTLESYARESATLQSLTTSVLDKSQQDPKISAFLDTFLTDKTAQLSLLESLKPSAASELSQNLVNTRTKALRDIVEILEKPNLSATERQLKLDRVMQKYTEKETKFDRKITKKLTFKDRLDEETENPELEDELAEEEDETLKEASSKLDKDELADFADELRRKEGDQSLVVLQKLLATVPESAKVGIETAIDAVIARQIETFRQDPTAIEQLLNEHSGSGKVRNLLLERIKEQASDENLKQQIELIKAKPEERAKKTRELKKETEKKAKESQEGDVNKQLENQRETQSPEAKPSEKSETKNSPSPETKNEATTVKIKIKEDGKFEKTSYTVKKNSSVAVRVESASTNPVTVSLSSGLGSMTISKGEEKSISPFIITGTVSFTAEGATGYIYTE